SRISVLHIPGEIKSCSLRNMFELDEVYISIISFLQRGGDNSHAHTLRYQIENRQGIYRTQSHVRYKMMIPKYTHHQVVISCTISPRKENERLSFKVGKVYFLCLT